MEPPSNKLSRRQYLQKLSAVIAIPSVTLTACGREDNDMVISGVRFANGRYGLAAFDTAGKERWQTPLPCRAHDVVLQGSTSHPIGICVARRPGKEAWLFNPQNGSILQTLTATQFSQFNGHASFLDQDTLCLSETHFSHSPRHSSPNNERVEGRIGVYSIRSGIRLYSFSSGGIDPHQCINHQNNDHIVVANGGWVEASRGQFPAYLDTKQPPNLSWVNKYNGKLLHQQLMENPLASARHIAVSSLGQVGLGLQIADSSTLSSAPHSDVENTGAHSPLVKLYSTQGEMLELAPPSGGWQTMKRYVASVAFNPHGTEITATSPRGNVVCAWSTASGKRVFQASAKDSAGVAYGQHQRIWTSGTGVIASNLQSKHHTTVAFDNHCAVTKIVLA